MNDELRKLVQAAAALSGRSVDDFVIQAVTETSRRVLEGTTPTVLSDRDRDRFMSLLDVSDEPNAALRAAADRCWPRHD